ncbi:HAD-IA family hydrolase [candidate division KSB1 bacterium]|nr:HAD-IA family hydrolase [candidate division KSB1 bacterium]
MLRDKSLLIFDLDGTLVDTRLDLATAVNHALQQLGRPPLPLAVLTGFVGDGARTLVARALGNPEINDLETALRFFRAYYAEHLVDHSRLYDGVLETLQHFRHKKKALLSNKPQEFTEPLLARLDLSKFFDVIVGARPDLKLKPDPQPVHFILDQLGVPAAGALIIGDGENDVLAGKAAGITTCAVTYGIRPAEKLLPLQPDFVIHNFSELKALMQ